MQVGLHLAASHPAPELMQLTQAEAFGVLDEHDNGVGNVHTHFHHRCGDQQVDFPVL